MSYWAKSKPGDVLVKHKLSTITLLMQILIINAISGCSSSEEQQEKYLNRAQALYEDGNYTKAKLELSNVLQINPQNADAFYLKALINAEDGELRSVPKNLQLAVEFDPNHVEARLKLGQILYSFGLGADESTMEQAAAVLELDPENADGNILLAMLLYRQEEKEAGIIKAQSVLQRDPGHVDATAFLMNAYLAADGNPDRALALIDNTMEAQPDDIALHQMKIFILAGQDDTDGTVEIYRSLIAKYPEEVEFHRSLVTYLVTKERLDEAEDVLRKLIETNPENLEIKIWLAGFLVQQRDLQLAETTVKRFITSHPDLYELRFALAEIYNAGGKNEEAAAVYTSIILDDGENIHGLKARNAIILKKLDTGDEAGAAALLKEVLEIEPANQLALNIQTILFLQSGDIQSAIEGARLLVQNDAKSSDAMFLLASAHEANGEKALALDYLRNALQLDATNIRAVVKAAALLTDQGDAASASRVLERGLISSSGDVSIALALFEGYMNQKRWSDAMELATNLAQIKDKEVLGAYLKAQVFFQRKDYADAKTAFKEVLELEPNQVEALSSLMKAQFALDEQQEAFEYLAQHITRNPEVGYPRQLQGNLYLQTGNIEAAIKSYSELLAIQPESVDANIALAQAYQARGDLIRTLNAYSAAHALRPDDPQVLTLKAGVLETLGRHQEAMEAYEDVLLLDSNQQIAANNLAMILIERLPSDKNFQRALELTLTFEDTEIATLRDTRGWAYYKAGDYTNALRMIKPIFESDNVGDIFWFHLGMTYYKLGDSALAKEALTKSVANEVEFSGRKEALSVLQKL